MTTRAAGVAAALGMATLGLAAAWWLTSEPARAPASRPSASVRVPAPAPPASGDAVATAGARRAEEKAPGTTLRPPGDDPALRARLYVHAKVAVAEWPFVVQRIDDPVLRAEAEAMVERLRRLDEQAETLARAEYDLTQRLIARGGWDRTTERRIQELNSAAAMVIQGG